MKLKLAYTKFKGRFTKSGPKRKPRNPLETAEPGGKSVENSSCSNQPRPTAYEKMSFRSSTCWDISDQVLTTLNTASQFASVVPYLGSLSAVALSIFRTAQSVKENREDVRELATAVSDLLSVVLKTYQELHRSNFPMLQNHDPTLDSHVEQLILTLQKIDGWIKGMQSKKLIRRLISSRSDFRVIQTFRAQLVQAKDDFKIQSLVALRNSVSRTEQKLEKNITQGQITHCQLSTIREDITQVKRYASQASALFFLIRINAAPYQMS
ncbi:hypothetical protein C8R42DRAFT_390643 [Lentinula raphanica]|nr:hypothetical protein C8R42DRAFT_390643 [Lentinula raphanica]